MPMTKEIFEQKLATSVSKWKGIKAKDITFVFKRSDLDRYYPNEAKDNLKMATAVWADKFEKFGNAVNDTCSQIAKYVKCVQKSKVGGIWKSKVFISVDPYISEDRILDALAISCARMESYLDEWEARSDDHWMGIVDAAWKLGLVQVAKALKDTQKSWATAGLDKEIWPYQCATRTLERIRKRGLI